jgi:hypothetical protein
VPHPCTRRHCRRRQGRGHGRGRRTDGTRVVLPLNPHNHGSYSHPVREWFCHSIYIITGVTLFYAGGGFIARLSPVTVPLCPRLLISFAASSLPRRGLIFRIPPSVIFFASTTYSSALESFRLGSCAHRNWESRPLKRLSSLSFPARVKDGNHVFGECRCGTTTHYVLFFPA